MIWASLLYILGIKGDGLALKVAQSSSQDIRNDAGSGVGDECRAKDDELNSHVESRWMMLFGFSVLLE